MAGLAGAAITPVARADDPPRVVTYIALGDSYTAAPLISKPAGTPGGSLGFNGDSNPYTCGQSTANYPRLIARWLGLYSPTDDVSELGLAPAHPQFTDISCGSAQTKHMTETQAISYGGSNPPQFSAFDDIDNDAVTLVTIGIGGNDVGFGDLQSECVEKPNAPGGHPCSENHELAAKVDAAMNKLAADLPVVLNRIHGLAPNAQVLVFGYPALLPDKPLVAGLPEGCWPYIPIVPADVPSLVELEARLNRIIEAAASTNDAHYVDWYTPSLGHDMCRPPGQAWVNGIVLAPPSFPVHPNVLGSEGAARAAIAVLETLGFTRADQI